MVPRSCPGPALREGEASQAEQGKTSWEIGQVVKGGGGASLVVGVWLKAVVV